MAPGHPVSEHPQCLHTVLPTASMHHLPPPPSLSPFDDGFVVESAEIMLLSPALSPTLSLGCHPLSMYLTAPMCCPLMLTCHPHCRPTVAHPGPFVPLLLPCHHHHPLQTIHITLSLPPPALMHPVLFTCMPTTCVQPLLPPSPPHSPLGQKKKGCALIEDFYYDIILEGFGMGSAFSRCCMWELLLHGQVICLNTYEGQDTHDESSDGQYDHEAVHHTSQWPQPGLVPPHCSQVIPQGACCQQAGSCVWCPPHHSGMDLQSFTPLGVWRQHCGTPSQGYTMFTGTKSQYHTHTPCTPKWKPWCYPYLCLSLIASRVFWTEVMIWVSRRFRNGGSVPKGFQVLVWGLWDRGAE